MTDRVTPDGSLWCFIENSKWIFLLLGDNSALEIKIRLHFDKCLNPSMYYIYQNYHFQGFKTIKGVTCKITPLFSKAMAYLHDANVRGANRIWNCLSKVNASRRSEKSDHVGRYSIDIDSKRFKVAIDVSDGRSIRDKEALEWCDIYFKSNKWGNLEYPAKVYPLCNGNSLLDFKKIDTIKIHRKTEKKVDLIYMSKIWSRTDCFVENIIEHQIRVFEVLADLGCTKFLRAIIPNIFINRMTEYLKRLDVAGVEWTSGWGDINSQVFWRKLAEAKIVFQRSGNHQCISWRMTDLLCMGACIVMDNSPYPLWPVPLEAGKHFVDCKCGFGSEYSIPQKEQYKRIRSAIEALLSNEEEQRHYSSNCAEYFDLHITPQHVAKYILNVLINKATANKISILGGHQHHLGSTGRGQYGTYMKV